MLNAVGLLCPMFVSIGGLYGIFWPAAVDIYIQDTTPRATFHYSLRRLSRPAVAAIYYWFPRFRAG